MCQCKVMRLSAVCAHYKPHTYLCCSAPPVWQIHLRFPPQLAFQFLLLADRYHHRWWRPTPTLWSCIRCFLLTPGDGGALWQAGCGVNHCCAFCSSSCWVARGVWQSGHSLLVGSGSRDGPGMRWSIGMFLSGWFALSTTHY